MFMKPATPIAILACLLLAACSSGETGDRDASEAPVEGPVSYPEERRDADAVATAIGLTSTGSGYYEWTTPQGETCEGLLLNGAGSVSMYADAGDVVASTPDQALGFKISGSNAKVCHADMTERLTDQ